MPIEKPISTIRKAVQGAAEELASKEHLQTPNTNHYEKVFHVFKSLRDVNPKAFEKVILVSAKGKELKDKLGKKMLKDFEEVLYETFAKYKNILSTGMEKIKKNKDQHLENQDEKINKFVREVFEEMALQLKNDKRLLVSFAGKETLLNDAIGFVQLNIPGIFENQKTSLE